MRPTPRTIIMLLLCGVLGSVSLAVLAVQYARTPLPAGRVDPMRLNLSEFRQLGLVRTGDRTYTLRIVAKEWFFDIGQTRNMPAQVVVPVGSRITIVATSMDVIHSLKIADNPLLMISPGYIAQQTIYVSQPGIFPFACGNYCGPNHSAMQAQLIVTP